MPGSGRTVTDFPDFPDFPDFLDFLDFLGFWGNAQPREDSRASWHPIAYHLLDVAASAEAILSARPLALGRGARLLGLEPAVAQRLIVVLVALHDLGKFSPAFQAKAMPDGWSWPAGLGAHDPTRLRGTRHTDDGYLVWYWGLATHARTHGGVTNIERNTIANNDFGRILFTGPHTQLGLMTLQPRAAPGHPYGTVHQTKQEAEASERARHGASRLLPDQLGRTARSCQTSNRRATMRRVDAQHSSRKLRSPARAPDPP
jgi:hypothetical protein